MSKFLADKFSPGLKALQRLHRESAPELAVAPGAANAGTIGTAFDWRIRFALESQPDLHLAEEGAVLAGPNQSALFDGLKEMMQKDEPRDEQFLGRMCWALAAFTEVYRAGMVFPGSPLSSLPARCGVAELLGMASAEAVQEIVALIELANTRLLGRVAQRGRPIVLGPIFEGSYLMRADADVIANGLLVEVKTGVGGKRRDGTRYACLESLDTYQVLGYVLLDFTDAYRLDAVALYSARYGYLAEWPLSDLLHQLAGRPLDLQATRAEFAELLRRLTDG